MPWKAPDGFTLTRHDGYWITRKGFRRDDPPVENDDGVLEFVSADRPVEGVKEGIGVSHFDEDEPFLQGVRTVIGDDGVARDYEGWSPNVTIRMIEGGYVPPVFTLVHDADDTPVVEPGRASKPTPAEQDAAQAAYDAQVAAAAAGEDVTA